MTARVRAARVPSMYCTAAFDLQLNRVHEIETGVLCAQYLLYREREERRPCLRLPEGPRRCHAVTDAL